MTTIDSRGLRPRPSRPAPARDDLRLEELAPSAFATGDEPELSCRPYHNLPIWPLPSPSVPND